MPAVVSAPDLKAWRFAIALSQRELAQRAGVSASTVGRIERTGRGRADIVERLHGAFLAERAAIEAEAE
jgi:transcriptional regulator with XRE-family HTH domain